MHTIGVNAQYVCLCVCKCGEGAEWLSLPLVGHIQLDGTQTHAHQVSRSVIYQLGCLIYTPIATVHRRVYRLIIIAHCEPAACSHWL